MAFEVIEINVAMALGLSLNPIGRAAKGAYKRAF